MSTLRGIVISVRPSSWAKNLVLFAGVVFSENLGDPQLFAASAAGFVLFCMLSGSVYLVNDVADAGRDRLHPEKRNRPIASGQVSSQVAIVVAALMAGTALVCSFTLAPPFGWAAVAYVTLNLIYCFVAKNVVILDVISISLGFVIRAIAGVHALWRVDPEVMISPWLLMCTLFLALFLALGKRRHELVFLEAEARQHRRSLKEYTPQLLDQMIPAVTAVVLIAYSLYTIWPGTVEKFMTESLIYTVPIVVYGVFRYLYLVHLRDMGGDPSRVLLTDRPILLCVFVWIIVVVGVIYLG